MLGGKVEWAHMLYYTFQSNALVFIVFGMLTYKTAMGLKKEGKRGNCGYFPRVSACAVICILLTIIIFWGGLAWQTQEVSYLRSWHNLSVHVITPVLMVADYILFSVPGKLKNRDMLLFPIFPIVYVTQALILGSAGVNYWLPSSLEPTGFKSFPYPFLDYTNIGWWQVVLYCILISVIVVGISYLLICIDIKRIKPKTKEVDNQEEQKPDENNKE